MVLSSQRQEFSGKVAEAGLRYAYLQFDGIEMMRTAIAKSGFRRREGHYHYASGHEIIRPYGERCQ
jgi:hypothetical protein